MTSPLTILTAARDLIADESHWNQGCFAVDANGAACDSMSPRAVKWCASGAIYKAMGTSLHYKAADMLDILEAASGALYKRMPPYVNDTLGHHAVMQVYDLAISTAPPETNNQ